ncbi:MAG: rod shape-determining protein MreC [Planctomycetaceae bacterium]|nr:rod shape-determining protein MreC [Planctomycetaceae bacterium]
MTPSSPKTKQTGQHLIPVLCLAVCGLLTGIPSSWQESARSLILDSVAPVQEGKAWLAKFGENYRSEETQRIEQLVQEHERERQRWELAARQQILLLAEARERFERRQSEEESPFLISEHRPLIEADVVSAEVLSSRQIASLERQLLIEVTQVTDAHPDQLVLQASENSKDAMRSAENLIIDRGTHAGVRESLPVMAGRCVVGKLADVGRRISRVQLITDPGYRGRARILRQFEDGYAYGPEGVFEGLGEELCRLRYVSSSNSIRVGDEVFTDDPLTSSTMPMYYGRIVKAELEENAHEWSIWVKPGCRFDTLSQVQILREQLTPLRSHAN